MSDGALLVQDLTYTGLDALLAVAPLDLCAYLHLSEDSGPQLFLATPTLASIEPTQALNLFAALRDALESGHDEHDVVTLAGYLVVKVTTKGRGSRGLHVLGRSAETFATEESRKLRELAERFGTLAHQVADLETATQAGGSTTPDVTVHRVAVETIDGAARADVTLQVGGENRSATADASTPLLAVATAALSALSPELMLVDARDHEMGGVRAVTALIATADDRRALGSALGADDTLRAAALAAIDARARLG